MEKNKITVRVFSTLVTILVFLYASIYPNLTTLSATVFTFALTIALWFWTRKRLRNDKVPVPQIDQTSATQEVPKQQSVASNDRGVQINQRKTQQNNQGQGGIF